MEDMQIIKYFHLFVLTKICFLIKHGNLFELYYFSADILMRVIVVVDLP